MSAIIPPISPTGARSLRLANGEDTLQYDLPAGTDWIVVQLTATESWTASAVVTLEISIDGAAFAGFPSGAVTYDALGVQEICTVTGVTRVRLRVSTPQAGTCVVTPVVRAGRDA